MALDDQLAALAAGDLDDDTARALRARAAADPALARRLARHEQLQRLMAGWDAPEMPADAVQRLDARLEQALEELGDEPLVDRSSPMAPLAGAPEHRPDPSSQPRGVVNLGRARQRRAASPGTDGGVIAWPSWGAGAAVAAALAAVVGTSIVLGGLPGGTGSDLFAGGDDSGEASTEMAEDSAGEEAAATGPSEDSGPRSTPEAPAELEEEAADGGGPAAQDSVPVGPQRRDGVDLAEGDLLALVDVAEGSPTEESTDEEAADTAAGSAEQCVTEALERDTSQADEREVWLLAEGTYAERDAAFVVIRTPAAEADRYEVLAYDPADCSLLARDETSR